MKKYLTEFIGTFFLVFTIGLAVLSGSALAPLAIGAGLMVMIYMGGHISGAHYNPAVSVVVLMRGVLPSADLIPYIIAQIVGAIVAAIMVLIITGQTFAPAPGPDASVIGALLVEILYTFALALVILNVSTSKRTEGNSFYGLAIGFTVVAATFAGGPVSGGAFNPAVGLGPVLVDGIFSGGTFANLWLYILGPLVGGALAAIVFNFQENG